MPLGQVMFFKDLNTFFDLSCSIGIKSRNVAVMYSVILTVLDPRKCEYLKDYSLDFEHAYMTTYLAS